MELNILLSNDDGVHAPGLCTLQKHLQSAKLSCGHIEQVWVLAPDRDCSGASHSLTLDKPLHVRWLASHRGSVEGTPTDCVHLAITGLLGEASVDVVVSGINRGANMGDDVLYSGTVAAAIEGRFLGLPSLAVSLVCSHDAESMYFDTAAQVVVRCLGQLISHPLPSHTILNINVPNQPMEAIKGYKMTRLGARHKAEPVMTVTNPRGQRMYWIGPAGQEEDAGIGTDFHAVREGYVSITPLKVDFTDYTAFDGLEQWMMEW